MATLTKFKGAVAVLREAWLLSRVPPNDTIFGHLRTLADEQANKPKGLQRYLQDYPSLGRIIIDRDWSHDRTSGEIRLTYSNSLFAHGCLRLKPGKKNGGIIVFFPGYQAGSGDALGDRNHPQYMGGVAEQLGMGIVSWDWPVQGSRRDACLYQSLRSTYSSEREYSRLLPVFGTCLWREMFAEMQFALGQIRRFVGPEPSFHVVGWSMGGCFAYLAPLAGAEITSTIAAGSCARIKDLLAEGKTRLHGYFFYPINALKYFDLDDIVRELLNLSHPLRIIHGDRDPGCLESTRKVLAQTAAQLGRALDIQVLPAHGHFFSPTLKRQIVAMLSEGQSSLNY